jgi:hypothetical protein
MLFGARGGTDLKDMRFSDVEHLHFWRDFLFFFFFLSLSLSLCTYIIWATAKTPSQICGCPFREPRVFEIACVYIYIRTSDNIYIYYIYICIYYIYILFNILYYI